MYFPTFFKFSTHNTSFKQEIIAGLTTFFTMSYIVFLTPAILTQAGMNAGAVFTASCLVIAISTLLIGLLANAPIAIAPGIPLTAFFTYIVVQTHHYHWQDALGMVFISGILFIILTITHIRHILLNSIPTNMHVAIVAGLSLLIMFIALKNSEIVTVSPKGIIALSDLHSSNALLFFLGFLLIMILHYYQISGAVLIGILVITILHAFIKPHQIEGLISLPPSLSPTLFKLEFDELKSLHAFKNIFAFFLIALFDATGTFIGLLNQSIFKQQAERKKTIERGLFADSIGTTLASLVGTPSTSPFIESAAGIEAGGRTGLTAIIISICFLLTLFLFPLAKLIPNPAVGAALLYVGCTMMRSVKDLSFEDITEFAPAVLVIVMIPFSFSIADGIGIGLITYTFLKIATKQWKDLNPILICLTGIFIAYFYMI